ncbi:MAG: P-loop NTPase fold protein [Opitutaceae bacterium]|nr:P-loop NTPase fold protein [Opitutaceae bacterium]
MTEADFLLVRQIVDDGRKPKLNTQPKAGPKTDGSATTSWPGLLAHPLSPAVIEIFDTAAGLVQRSNNSLVLRSDHLLDALLAVGMSDLRSGSANNTGAAVHFLQQLSARNEAFVQRRLERAGDAQRASAKQVPGSPSAATVLERAVAFARETGREGNRVAARHLVAALLDYCVSVQKNTSAGEVLITAGYDLAELRAEFIGSLITSGPEDEREAWRRLFPTPSPHAQSPSPTALPPSPDDPRTLLPSFNADLSSGEDKLGMRPDIEAMASLVVSQTLQPPLSIGLFGNWGSGKSFFMGKLRGEICRLAQGEDAARGGAYWPNVVTVEFNAWHYVDANLWASMVSHLFGELRRWGTGTGAAEKTIADEIKKEKDKALNNLNVAREARDAAKKRLKEAQLALAQAQGKHDKAIADVRDHNDKLSRQLARDLWGEIADKSGLKAAMADAQKKLHAGHLATTETVESVERLHAQLKELGETGGRLRATALTMLHGGKGRGALAWVLAGTVVALLLGVRGVWKFDFGPLAGVVAQSVAIVIGATQWITRSARHVGDLIKPLAEVRQKIEGAFQKAKDDRDQKVAQFKKDVEVSMVEVTVSTQALTTAEQAVAEAQAAVNESPTARMISRFIEGRAASDDYRKHLGIVSTIREDFDRLSGLITAHNEALRAPIAEATPAAVAKATTDLGINRIVLFIDDLDRCPPARVVEVLQAIHLLLAFPLFVVVVGVDSRWVEHSLAVQYPELLKRAHAAGQREAKLATEAEEPPARPSDYLEKIFQIPYRVRPIDDTGCRNLIDALVTGDRDSANGAGKSPPSLPSPGAGPEDTRAWTEKIPPLPTNDTKLPSGTSPGSAPPPPVPAHQPQPVVPPRLLIESLRLTEPEITTMKWLAPLIGRSPRATKRFVNIYRLLKAAVPQAEQRVFAAGGFRVPMLLLAVAAKDLGLAQKIHAATGRASADLREALANLSPQLTDPVAEKIPEPLQVTENAWKEMKPEDFSYWQRRVAQFSFEETARGVR